jgi:histidinol-phosphate aminotransferase
VAIDQVRQPFHVNVAAQAAAVEALRHQDEVERRVTQTIASRVSLVEEVRRLGLWVADSDANFIWVRLGEEAAESDVLAGLRERGVVVRAGASLGREGALRVTVGTDAENERFVGALRELV